LLHQHLESVSSQAAKIRQTATDSGASPAADGDNTEDADTKLAELRSLVTYLRREKEIVDLQLDVTKQENSRLKNRVDDLSQSLQEARATLSEVRPA
jgi:nucleoprotein TPR